MGFHVFALDGIPSGRCGAVLNEMMQGDSQMGLDLRNSQGERWRISYGRWADLLGVAHEHGWEPQGAKPPVSPDGDLPGDRREMLYFTSDCYTITTADAQHLADGLERALREHSPDLDKFPRTYVKELAEFVRVGEIVLS